MRVFVAELESFDEGNKLIDIAVNVELAKAACETELKGWNFPPRHILDWYVDEGEWIAELTEDEQFKVYEFMVSGSEI